MLAAPDLDVLWVVGANPLKDRQLAAANAFVVVQDLFLTETAQRADIVLPAACAYEKSGTVTNVCGEIQRLTRAITTMGVKPDLEIFRWLAKEMGLDRGVLPRPSGRGSVRNGLPSRTAAGPGSLGGRHAVHFRHIGALFEDAELP